MEWPERTLPGMVLLLQSTLPSGRTSWLHFAEPESILCAHAIDQVEPLLAEAEAAAQAGCYAAGFISYEAAPAFDAALRTRELIEFPLLWFGIYRKPAIIATSPRAPLAAPGLDWAQGVDDSDYRAALARIERYIAAGDTYQVNYTVRLKARCAGDPLALFAQLLAAQQTGYAAYIDTGDHAICSVSPELFFRLDGDSLLFRPMKGTARRGRYLAEDRQQAEWLRKSAKNQAENVMIVDMIRNDVARVARPGTVRVAQLFEVERYATLWQMTSTVTADTAASVAEIFRATFPCASVTGAPKVRTMQIIRELEPEPRGIYTGAIGYLAPGREAQFNVAIRTVQIDRARGDAVYGTGGGIVADSDPESEYAECRTKALVLAAGTTPFCLIETLRWTPAAGFHLLREHLDRLRDSAAYFGIPIAEQDIRDRLQAGIGAGGATPLRVRLLVAQSGEIRTESSPLAADTGPVPAPMRVALAAGPVDTENVFLYHKTTRLDEYDRLRVGRPDCDDVLLWNAVGEVTEFTRGNLVVARGAERFTPPIASGLLAGTLRRALLDRGELRERRIAKDELMTFDALYFINSVRGQIRVELRD